MAGTIGALTQIGIAKESSWNTAVPPTVLVPAATVSIDPYNGRIVDEALDGNLNYTARGSWAGRKYTKIQFSTLAFPKLIGHFLMGAFGIDAVTGVTGASQHTFTASASTLPPSYTFTWFDGHTTNLIAGCRLNSAAFAYKASAEDAVTVTLDYVGTIIAQTSAQTLTSLYETPIKAWELQPVIAGSTNSLYQDWTVTFDRKATPILTAANQQGPNDMIQGPIDGKFTATALYDSLAEFNRSQAQSGDTVKLTAADSTNQLQFIATGPSWDSVKVSPTKAKEQTVSLGGRLVYNSSDSGLAQVTLQNAQTTSY